MKHIVLDVPTKAFLASLRALRKKAGKSLNAVASEALKSAGSVLGGYERGQGFPLLENLMRLTEYFSYDLSESVNYKYYHGQIRPASTRQRMTELGLTYLQLATQTGYSEDNVRHSVRQVSGGSLLCLAAVLEVMSALKGVKSK